MKQTLIMLLAGSIAIVSCQGQQSKAMKDQQKAYDILNDQVADGRVATTAGDIARR